MPREFIQELREIAFEIVMLWQHVQKINDTRETHVQRAARQGGR
jgi:hypothetical protein